MSLLDAFAQAYDRRCQLHGRSDQTAYRTFQRIHATNNGFIIRSHRHS